MKPELVVSVEAVAALRACGRTREPDPIHFALQAELAGATGIRAHLRVGHKFINEEDISLLNRLVKTSLYLQASPHQDVLHLVNALRPHHLILANERRDEHSSDPGLDVILLANELKGLLPNIDIRQTSVFFLIDPELDQIKMAAKLGAQGVVLNVRDLMAEPRFPIPAKRLAHLRDAVRMAVKFSLVAHLSGGIVVERLPELTTIPGLAAVHMGHQLVARSLQSGVSQAVSNVLRHFHHSL